ncbi:glycosyltransferase [bacterium]|nr:glycosyltransferase [bacterium]
MSDPDPASVPAGQPPPRVAGRKLVFFTHQRHGTSSVVEPFAECLEPLHPCEVVIVRFPFLSSPDGATIVERQADGRTMLSRHGPRFYRPALLSYLKDVLLALWLGWRYARDSDVVIGTTNLLALAAVALRRLGVTRAAVYWIIDFTPRRWPGRLLNAVYYAVDRWVCEHVDRVWSLNQEMFDGRVSQYGFRRPRIRHRVVPHGNNSHRYAAADQAGGDPQTICYFGGLVPAKGAKLFVPILRALRDRGFAEARLLCIGDGDLDAVRAEAGAAGLQDRVQLTGPVPDHAEIERLLLRGGVAIAPYDPADRNSFSYYADPGKVKVYLGCGLPVVITAVPPIAATIAARGAGLVAAYDGTDFAAKLAQILAPAQYPHFRQRASELGREFQWPTICAAALADLWSD